MEEGEEEEEGEGADRVSCRRIVCKHVALSGRVAW